MTGARTALCLAAAGLMVWAGPVAAQSAGRGAVFEIDETDPLEIPLPRPRPQEASSDQDAEPVPTGVTGAAGAEAAVGPASTAAPAVDPVSTGSVGRRTAADDPYAPLGIRVGRHLLLPSVELSAGYTDNASGSAGGGESGILTVAPRLEIRTDQANHDTTIVLRGSYQTYTDGVTDDQPSAGAELESRIDLIDGWEMTLAADYNYDQQSVSDPDFPAGVDSAPGIHQYGGEAVLGRHVGLVGLDVGARVERSDYEDGVAGGVVVDQSDRTYTLVEGRVRTGLEMGGSIEPFVEGRLFHRHYDQAVNSNGLRLTGTGYQVRGGLAIRSEPVLSGEVAVGYREERRDDPALQDLSALTVDGSLIWSPVRLVSVTFSGNTVLGPTDDATTQGSVTYSGSLELTYQPRPNLTLGANGSVTAERYIGTGDIDYTFAVGAGLSWQINRFVQVDTTYRHDWLEAADSSRDYHADTVRLGLTLRK